MSAEVIEFGTRLTVRPNVTAVEPTAPLMGMLLELQKELQKEVQGLKRQPEAKAEGPIWRPDPQPLPAEVLWEMKLRWNRQLVWVEAADQILAAVLALGRAQRENHDKPWSYRHPMDALARDAFWQEAWRLMRLAAPTNSQLAWKLKHKDLVGDDRRAEAAAIVAEDQAWLDARFANCRRLPRQGSQ